MQKLYARISSLWLLCLFFQINFLSLQAQNCLPDDITITTQFEIDLFSLFSGGCTHVVGNLTLTDNSDHVFQINDLTPLLQLTSIGGDLIIDDNPILSTLDGLDNILTIGGNILIQDNPLLDLPADFCGVFPVLNPPTGLTGTFTTTGNGLNPTSAEVITACTPVPVPTLSQWGLIFLSLLLLSFGVVMISQPEVAFPGGNQAAFSINQLPFDKKIYSRFLLSVGSMVIFGFTIAGLFFGYEMTYADVPGSLMCIPIAAYLGFLLFSENQNS